MIYVGDGGFRIDYRSRLGPDWRAQSVTVERWNSQGPGKLRYVDLVVSRGFEADLVVDDSGLVLATNTCSSVWNHGPDGARMAWSRDEQSGGCDRTSRARKWPLSLEG